MTVHMLDMLTNDEAAAYLRLSERKLYELVASAAVPCTTSLLKRAVSSL